MSSRAPWNNLYEAKRRYSWERASSIIKASAISVQSTHPCIPCRQWLRLSSQHLLYLLSYLGAALCIQADAVPRSHPKRASLSMWWREEIKFYTVMYWCLKHKIDVSFFYRRIWDPSFSILIGRQCNWHPLLIKRNCCSWCLVKVWRRPAHQAFIPQVMVVKADKTWGISPGNVCSGSSLLQEYIGSCWCTFLLIQVLKSLLLWYWCLWPPREPLKLKQLIANACAIPPGYPVSQGFIPSFQLVERILEAKIRLLKSSVNGNFC
jgi:hypothetical protein